MKTIIICLTLLFFTARSQGQAPNPAINKKQLAPLSYLIGSWKGTATIQQRGGATLVVNQEEKISWELDSLLIKIEGIGKDPATQKKNFHAYALISYNPITQQLGMRSYTHEGYQTDAYFKILGTNQFEWGFDLPANRGKIRYTITLSETERTWVEKGEFSADGNTWYPTLSMSLVKQ
ncbi:MAG: hypothetical protein JNJ65_05545 [Cyclobacteriaceae bacterium]|jgi:hypothetical protein|nr:hypothetical protein [Cyclobacteriaceae bacterium]